MNNGKNVGATLAVALGRNGDPPWWDGNGDPPRWDVEGASHEQHKS